MKPYIIAELCGQWGGDVSRAEQMILQCKMGGADAVKVQLYDTYKLPGENRSRWEYLAMKYWDFLRLLEYSKMLHIDFIASVFDEERWQWIKRMKLPAYKIASSLLEIDFELARKQVNTGIKTFVSLGKWTDKELPFKNENVYYMHCLSEYPHTLEQAIEHMPEKFEGSLIGYSDHSIGIEACKLAYMKGAKIIEKHFTINTNLQCETETAHACSMTLKELIDLKNFILTKRI